MVDTFRIETREILRRIEFEKWKSWQLWLFEVCEKNYYDCKVNEDNSYFYSSSSVKHWESEIATPYEELSESLKQLDRDQIYASINALLVLLKKYPQDGVIYEYVCNPELIEILSSFEHDRWTLYQKAFHNSCIKNEDGSMTLDKDLVSELKKISSSDYDQLENKQRFLDSELELEDKILTFIYDEKNKTTTIGLKNKNISVEISPLGGSIINAESNGEEFLWQNESGIWPNLNKKQNLHVNPNPILFPATGPLKRLRDINLEDVFERTEKDGVVGYIIGEKFYSLDSTGYFFDGKFYEMKQHGFARDEEFELIKYEEKKCTFKLTSNERTKKSYPFDFELIVEYELTRYGVKTKYTVKNTSSTELPFNIGNHPGFNISGDLKEYYLVFDSDENAIGLNSSENLYHIYKIENGIIRLDEKMFENGAIKFKGVKSKRCTLMKNQNPVARYNIKSDTFLLWSADPKEFVCIEPWYGEPYALNDINGDTIKKLSPGEEFSFERNMSLYNEELLKRLNAYKNESNEKTTDLVR